MPEGGRARGRRKLAPQCNHCWHDAKAEKEHPGADHVCMEVRGHRGKHVCILCRAKS